MSAFSRAARPAWYVATCDGASTEEIPMNAIRRKTCLPAVAVLMSSLVLVACGDGPALTEEASAPSGDAAATQPRASVAVARTPAASPERDRAGPTRARRTSDAAPSGACPSPADEPAPIDGGREVTPVPEPEAVGPEPAPAPVPPESTGNSG